MDRAEVVIIDDQESILWILSEILSLHGISHATASSGTKGLELIAEHQPRLAIVDVKLGAMSGTSVARRVPAISPRTGVLFLTGNVASVKGQVFDNLDVVGVVGKPFDINHILSLVRTAVKTESDAPA